MGLAGVVIALALGGAAEEAPGDAKTTLDPSERKWFLMVAVVNAYPALESEELVDKFFEPFVRTLAPGFGDAATVSDLRDDHLLWTPYLGIGRVLSDRWAVFFQAGASSGKVRTNENERSRFFLPLAVDFEIQRGAAYFGFGLDYFPWGMPERRPYEGVVERIKAARPSLGARLTWTYATFDAKAKLGFRPLPNFINVELSDSWFLPSVNLNVGLDVPIGPRSQLSFNGGYAFFWDREFDFEGAAYTVGWKYFFR